MSARNLRQKVFILIEDKQQWSDCDNVLKQLLLDFKPYNIL